MFGNLSERMKNRHNNKKLKPYNKILNKINSLGEKIAQESDEQLKKRVENLRSSCERGEDTLIESFAICREASDRVLGMKHYDVQVLCGLALNDNKISEMKTGEGKTLSATLPIFYRSLLGEQVHLVTANDYLANRDRNDLSALYDFLGVKAGSIFNGMNGPDKKKVYEESHVIYGTASEFAFDYLRDNTSTNKEHLFQEAHGHSFAIVDEIDSILIDEARSPLVISGEGELDKNMVFFLNKISSEFSVKKLAEKPEKESHDDEEDVILYEKSKDASLTDNGFDKLERILVDNNILPYAGALYETKNLYVVDRFLASIRGIHLFINNVDYVVKDGRILIINEQTGRIEDGRRWSDGLHQVIEAKEGVEIHPESRSLASTTMPNYFRLYKNISGMTGTAQTDAEEFMSVYGLDIVSIPTNKPMIRKDEIDQIFLTEKVKMREIVKDIKSAYFAGRPVLVGTSSVEESEAISLLLKNNGLAHNILNAKNHFREADIISQAGMPKMITISTNMAGRGTDIILGGNLNSWIKGLRDPNEDDINALREHWKELNKKVIESGGLHVVGTSRNSSRRVDNQLMGRSGRQGDPGSSVFYVSMEDQLLKLFGTDKYAETFKSLGINEDDCISSSLANKGIFKSQLKMEELHFKMRKELFKYDDIINIQRTHIYDMRSNWLSKDFGSIKEVNQNLIEEAALDVIEQFMPRNTFEETWDIEGLELFFKDNWMIEIDINLISSGKEINEDLIREKIISLVLGSMKDYLKLIPDDANEEISRTLMVQTIDTFWYEGMHGLERLKQGIHLRGMAQKDPLMEFKKESIQMFEIMMSSIKEQYAASLMSSLKSTFEANTEIDEDTSESEVKA